MNSVKLILAALFFFSFGFLIVNLFLDPKIRLNEIKQTNNNLIPSPQQPTSKIYGINISGGEFGEENLPGIINKDYIYPHSTEEYKYFRGKNLNIIRLPIRWERVQHEEFGELYTPDINQIKQVLSIAEQNNMRIILDLHNFGRYYGKALSAADADKLSDIWTKLALTFQDEPGLYGYELMNEPHDLPGGSNTWAQIAQIVTTEIRKVDNQTLIIVPGYNWQNAQNWTKNNPGFPISDPENNLIYSAHIYFDSAHSGRYSKSFDDDRRNTDIGVTKSADFKEWLMVNDKRGMFTEFGVPDNDPRWLTTMDKFLANIYKDPHITGAIYWGAGPWWKNYSLSVEPVNGVDRPQMKVIQKYSKREL